MKRKKLKLINKILCWYIDEMIKEDKNNQIVNYSLWKSVFCNYTPNNPSLHYLKLAKEYVDKINKG